MSINSKNNQQKNISVIPSILAGKHSNLINSYLILLKHKIKKVHIDIMDGYFVPNLSFGPQLLKELKKIKKIFFDTHLMVEYPMKFIQKFYDAGSNNITIHIESKDSIRKCLNLIKSLNCYTGLAIKDSTNIEALFPYLEKVNQVLIMTVNPGFGGQKFNKKCLEKIKQVNFLRKKYNFNYNIAVDGGINIQTAKMCINQGANDLITGTSFFNAKNKDSFISNILNLN